MAFFISRRSTTWSTMPCSSKNSALWKSFGNSCLIVSWMTRGPAKPINAPRLRQVYVSQHGKGRRDSSGSWISKDRYIR